MAAEAGHVPNYPYTDQNGDEHLNSANLFDGAEAAIAQSVGISAVAGGANVSLVTFQVKDGRGAGIARPFLLTVWLSDDAAGGAGLTATAASGNVQAGASGTDLAAKTAKKCLDVMTDATGKYVLSVTDAAKTGFVPCTLCPGTGSPQVGPALTGASYG